MSKISGTPTQDYEPLELEPLVGGEAEAPGTAAPAAQPKALPKDEVVEHGAEPKSLEAEWKLEGNVSDNNNLLRNETSLSWSRSELHGPSTTTVTHDRKDLKSESIDSHSLTRSNGQTTGDKDSHSYRLGKDQALVDTRASGEVKEEEPKKPESKVKLKVSVEKKLVEKEIGAKKVESKAELYKNASGASVAAKGYVQGPHAEVSSKIEGSLDKDGGHLEITLSAKADLLDVGGHIVATKEFEIDGQKFKATIDLGAEGKVGIDGDFHLNVTISKDGKAKIEASASAFAGIKGSLSGDLKLEAVGSDGKDRELIETKITLSGYLGATAAAKFELEAGLHDTKFAATAKFAVGAGMGVAIEGTVHPDAMLETGAEMIENEVEHVLNDMTDSIGVNR